MVPPRRKPARLPRIVLTGDSLMAVIDTFIDDRLHRGVEVVSDTHPGSGVSKRGFDWPAHARRETGRLRPRATVVLLGANDGVDMRTPDGVLVGCCAEPWIREYARRVERMMRAYSSRRGKVVWLTLPAPRSSGLAAIFAAVNQAVRLAAEGEPKTQVVPIDEILTPGFRFRSSMEIHGQLVRVRDSDGLHFSVAGASFVAGLVVRALRTAHAY